VGLVARTGRELDETAQLIGEAGGSALAAIADVTVAAEVDGAFRALERELGSVDLLVNNAGSCRAIGPIWEVDPTEWWSDVEVNLRGTFLCTRAVVGDMVARGSGRIINVASWAATETAPYITAYACSKAAVLKLTEGLAAATRAHGVAVFAIGPGLVRTAMTRFSVESELGRRWLDDFHGALPGSWVEPERAAELVALLASGRADRLSGRFVHVFDDVDALLRRVDEIERGNLLTLRLAELPPATGSEPAGS